MALNNEENLRRLKFDLNGGSDFNRIVEEHLVVDFPNSAFVVPSETPFFESGLELVDSVTMQPLVKDVDYRLVILATKATMDTGLPCWSAIEIVNPATVRDVFVRYGSVGGLYNDNLSTIRDLIGRVAYNQNQAVYWENIENKPIYYPPTNHTHPLYEVNALNALNDALEQMVEAMFSERTLFKMGANVDLSSLNELERMLNRHIAYDDHRTSPDVYLTVDEVNDIIMMWQKTAEARVVPTSNSEKFMGEDVTMLIDDVLVDLNVGQLIGSLPLHLLAPIQEKTANQILISDGSANRWVDVSEYVK